MHKLILACLALLGTLYAGLVFASATPDGKPGMVVVRDPQTGEWRMPTPAEMKALRARAPAVAPSPPPKAELRADGSRMVRLGEQHQIYSLVSRDAGGKTVMQCVHGDPSSETAPQPATKENGHETE
jgi:hypothetical protein